MIRVLVQVRPKTVGDGYGGEFFCRSATSKGPCFCLVEDPSLARRANVCYLLSLILVFIVVFQIVVGMHGITRIKEEIA